MATAVVGALATLVVAGLLGGTSAALAAPAVRPLPASTAAPSALVHAYTKSRGPVAGVRAGSEHVADVTATGVEWAVASFGAPAGATRAAVELQDGADAGIFRREPGGTWSLVAPGLEPLACDATLPAAVRAAWDLAPGVTCGGASPAGAAGAAANIEDQTEEPSTIGAAIATTALGQVGESDQPAVDSFDTVDCDPYTTMVGPVYADADNRGCGYNGRFGVEDENEEWCADFADWVWLHAGITEDMDLVTPAASSFYDWGAAQKESLTVDGSDPQVGDAVVFYPSGAITTSTAADHVGIVSSVNANGTVDLVNGDFLGTSNISVQYDTDVELSTWAPQIWGAGEQWVLVTPPTAAQLAAPSVTISGPHVAGAGTETTFSASGSQAGGSIKSYEWAFGDGGYVPGGSADGTVVHHVFADPGQDTVSLLATSSLGTVRVSTWDVDVIAGSSSATSTPSDALYYDYTPVEQRIFSRATSGGLVEESWDGTSWLDESLPGDLAAGAAPAALDYKDADDALAPHVFYRSSAGTLAETYQQGPSWLTATLPGSTAAGSPVAAAVMASAGGDSYPAVFGVDSAGRLVESSDASGKWTATTFGAAGDAGKSVAAGVTTSGSTAVVDLYSVDSKGALVVTSQVGTGWSSKVLTSSLGVAPGSTLVAVATGSAGQPAVFFVDKADHLAEATSPDGATGWTTEQVTSDAITPTAALLAADEVPASGVPVPEVVGQATSHKAVLATSTGTTWSVETLPAASTALLGLAAYPVPGSGQSVVFDDSKAVEADATATATAKWASTALPASPVSFAGRILLYAASAANETTARTAGADAGLPAARVTGSFATAWAAALSGDYLVVAVGTAAAEALEYNVCGWQNPSGDSAGSTPFDTAGPPLDKLPGAYYFEQASGSTSAKTASLADDLAYYAVHGRLPAGVTILPAEASIAYACTGKASA